MRIWDNALQFFRYRLGARITRPHDETSLPQDSFERFMKEYEERLRIVHGSGNTKPPGLTGSANGHSGLWYRWPSRPSHPPIVNEDLCGSGCTQPRLGGAPEPRRLPVSSAADREVHRWAKAARWLLEQRRAGVRIAWELYHWLYPQSGWGLPAGAEVSPSASSNSRYLATRLVNHSGSWRRVFCELSNESRHVVTNTAAASAEALLNRPPH
jgi:hypothetical protein